MKNTPQYHETQEERLTKAKILSLRLRRSIFITRKRSQAIDFVDCNSQNECLQNKFHQIGNRGKLFQLKHKKRQVEKNYTNGNATIESDGNRSSDANLTIFQVKQKLPKLQVTDNGELILLDVTERDQVCSEYQNEFECFLNWLILFIVY